MGRNQMLLKKSETVAFSIVNFRVRQELMQKVWVTVRMPKKPWKPSGETRLMVTIMQSSQIHRRLQTPTLRCVYCCCCSLGSTTMST